MVPSEFGVGRTVGRTLELEQIDATLEGLATGAPACITVEGEPGIGKTHLVLDAP